MTANEIKAALAELDLTQEGAARLFRYDARSVQRWIYGERGIPQGIAILLHLMLDKKVTADDVRAAAAKI